MCQCYIVAKATVVYVVFDYKQHLQFRAILFSVLLYVFESFTVRVC